MSDALACDGPDCQNTALAPYLGWWRLESAALVVVMGQRDRLDFCSWECLGAFVMQEAGTVRDLERRLTDS